jgi:hypothetical protein
MTTYTDLSAFMFRPVSILQTTKGKVCKVTMNVGPCHHGTARPQVADGGTASYIWRVAVNKLNKQPWTVDEGWSFGLGVGRGSNNPSP